MNHAVFDFINKTIKNPVFDQVIPLFSDKDFVVIPGIVVFGLVLYFGRRHARTCMLALLLAFLLADVGSEKVIKEIFKAKRPYAVVEDTNVHRNDGWIVYDPAWYGTVDTRKTYGFPSSHAANVAAFAVVLAFINRKTLYGTVPLAFLVGFSRIYTGDHFPSQVLAGYCWGSLCGYAAVRGAAWGVRRVWGPPPEVETPNPPLTRQRKMAYALLGGWLVLNFVFLHLGVFDLSGDEAQYWDWSRQPALGYYSKPPMIAYVMDALTGAGGSKAWAIRSGAVLFSTGALALLYALTHRISGNERAALIAMLAAMAMPASWAGAVILTIDPVLIFFWVLALFAFHRAVNAVSSREAYAMWLLTGAALGCGMLSKYTAAVLFVVFGLYLALVDRRHLRRPGPYIAVAVSLLFLSGVLYWNWVHDWVSFRHTAHIGASDEQSAGRSIQQVLLFFGAQAGMVSPILFGFMLWAWWRCLRQFRQDKHAAFLALAFGVLFVFYAVVSITHTPQPNWPVAAYPAAAMALGWTWVRREPGKTMRRLLVAGIVLGCILGIAPRMTGLAYVMGRPPAAGESDHMLHVGPFTVSPDIDPTVELVGSRALGEAVGTYTGHEKLGPFIFSERYQTTALLAFYTPGRPRTYCLPYPQRRQNQYDMWGGWGELGGRDAIFVTGKDEKNAMTWARALVDGGLFEDATFLESVDIKRGHTIVKSYSLIKLTRYSGEDLRPPSGY